MAEPSENQPPARQRKRHSVLLWILGILGILILLVFIASFFMDEPLRKMTERRVNDRLKGYTVRIDKLHLQLIGFSMTIKGLSIRQQAHPEPPVAYFPYFRASVHWREILSGKLVADFRLNGPRIHVNRAQLQKEAEGDDVKMKDRGWQEAVEAIYPLKVNVLKINDASITYIDQDPKRPLTLSDLNLRAENIRNIHLPDKVYPSSFHLDTKIFKTGYGEVDGKANFLAKPFPGSKSAIKLEKVPLEYFKPLAARYNVDLEGGVLNAKGNLEYAPKVQVADLDELNISGVKADYIHSEKTAALEKKRARKVQETAKELTDKPRTLITADKVSITGSNLGMINDVAGKKYRLFLSNAELYLNNFSNKFSRGPAKMELKGMFMGSGVTRMTGTFRPEKKGPDLDLYLKIDPTQLTSLNDLLRAYGKFDVVAGTFSMVTELHVKDAMVTGYIKPFFKDMKVYDRRQDKEKGLFRKVYEMLVGGVAKLLENKRRDQVATKAEISGPIKNPETSTWQIVIQLLRNAFFKAILPTFEREASGKR
jgi:hypothetical protein